MTKLLALIKTYPLYSLIIAGLIVLLLFMAANGIGKSIEIYRANRFEKAQAAQEKEIAEWKVRYDAAVKRADIAEANALLKEKEAKDLKQLIDANGGKIAKTAAELEKAIEEAKRDAGTCNGDAACLCSKLRAIGIACQ
jgi:aspartyl-tRNA synthetase